MTSVVESLKDALEANGEYVVLSNTDWFAIFPATLESRVDRSKELGRLGPNLIVYRTRTSDPRDHYAIPFSVIGDLLAEETLSDSKAGKKRWNLTLANGKLHVSHRPGKVDVEKFRGVPLVLETSVPSELLEPTTDVDELEKRVSCLRKLAIARPKGQVKPSKHVAGSRIVYERRPDVKAWVLSEAKGHCELCLCEAPFIGDDGEPFLELHHVQQLAHGGPDTVENAVAICPDCHRWLHHGADRSERREQLYQQVGRLVRQSTAVSSDA